jgi:hypothetical protein
LNNQEKQQMSTKNNPGNFDCYAAALPDEPMFILLARDRVAPIIILEWVEFRRRNAQANHAHLTLEEETQLNEAAACAAEMINWRKDNYGSWWGSMGPPIVSKVPSDVKEKEQVDRELPTAPLTLDADADAKIDAKNDAVAALRNEFYMFADSIIERLDKLSGSEW